MIMLRFFPVILPALFFAIPVSVWSQEMVTPRSLWNVPALLGAAPSSEIGAAAGLTKPVWYDGEPWQGKKTRIFAWLGEPAGSGNGKLPAVLLVHGGGGKAFQDWAKHWAERGYVALAMDTAGQGPDGKRHADAGPGQDDAVKFRDFTDGEAREQWSYHAVAAVLRGHALLASLPSVDASRIGITGISWGGYLTCLTAGLDPQLRAAVPVYGCGFLGDNSVWKEGSLAALPVPARERWLRLFDPAQVLDKAACPVLFCERYARLCLSSGQPWQNQQAGPRAVSSMLVAGGYGSRPYLELSRGGCLYGPAFKTEAGCRPAGPVGEDTSGG